MRRLFFHAGPLLMVASAMVGLGPAYSMTIKEFRKFSQTEQGTYIGAAVSMLSYSVAVNGDVVRARCIQDWYFGKKGSESAGPRAVTIEIAVAGDIDAAKYHVEGVILGLAEKACNAVQAPRSKQK